MTGEEFRDARIKACITQRRLGEMLGYEGRSAESVVQNWEYGRQPIPLKHIRKLAKILEIPIEKFIP